MCLGEGGLCDATLRFNAMDISVLSPFISIIHMRKVIRVTG